MMYYLKDKMTGEIADVIASSLNAAQEIASRELGGAAVDWIERF